MSDLQAETEASVDPQSLEEAEQNQPDPPIKLSSNVIHRTAARSRDQGTTPFLSTWLKFTQDDDPPGVDNAMPIRFFIPPVDGNFVNPESFSKLQQLPLKPALVISGETPPAPGDHREGANRFYSFIPDLSDPVLQQVMKPEDLAEGQELLEMFSEIARGGSETVRDIPVAIDSASNRAEGITPTQIQDRLVAFQQKIVTRWLGQPKNATQASAAAPQVADAGLTDGLNLGELSAELAFMRNEDPALSPFLESGYITPVSLWEYLEKRDPTVRSEQEMQSKLTEMVSSLINANPESLAVMALMSPSRRADLLATHWNERMFELKKVARDLSPVFQKRPDFRFCSEQLDLVLQQDQIQPEELGSANLSSFLSQLEQSAGSEIWSIDALTYFCNLSVGSALGIALIDPLHRFQLLRIPMETEKYTKARVYGHNGIKRRLAEKWTRNGRRDIANLLNWDPYSPTVETADLNREEVTNTN